MHTPGWNKNNMFELYTTSPHGQTGSVGEQSLTTHALTGSIRSPSTRLRGDRSQPTRLRGAIAHNPKRSRGAIARSPRAHGEQALTTHALTGGNRSPPTRCYTATTEHPLSHHSYVIVRGIHQQHTITQHYNMHHQTTPHNT